MKKQFQYLTVHENTQNTQIRWNTIDRMSPGSKHPAYLPALQVIQTDSTNQK